MTAAPITEPRDVRPKIELTSASEVLALLASDDAVIATLKAAGTHDSVLIEVAYSLIAQRKDALLNPHGSEAARCQACGGEVQGFMCQSCDATFTENEEGWLIIDTETHGSEAVAWRYEKTVTWSDGSLSQTANVMFSTRRPAESAAIGNVTALYAQPSEQTGGGGDRRAKVIDAICRTSQFGPDYKHADLVRIGDAILAALSTPEVVKS